MLITKKISDGADSITPSPTFRRMIKAISIMRASPPEASPPITGTARPTIRPDEPSNCNTPVRIRCESGKLKRLKSAANAGDRKH